MLYQLKCENCNFDLSKYVLDVKVVLSGEGADELFGGYNIYREPESLKKIAWIPFGVRRVIGKLAAKLPDVKGRDFLIRAGMKVEERFIGN
ncbi:asparagine synthase-related protein, partial [Blautia glucerasea]